MCSTDAARIALICRAIEELASTGPGVAARDGQAGRAGASAADDDVAGRLAAIWAMIAEVDPGLAKRLPGYLTAAE